MKKQTWSWASERLPAAARVVRWGHYGAPVLLFPSAGGDCEEVERFGLVGALAPLIDAGRIKVYGIDAIATRTALEGRHSDEYCARVRQLQDAFIREELAPLVRTDCASPGIELVAAGASFGACSALGCLLRDPQLFRHAIALSACCEPPQGAAGLSPQQRPAGALLQGLAELAEDGQPLQRLRTRFALLATGAGDYEDAGESQRCAQALAARRVPHRLENWGRDWHHDWPTWRAMLPKYLAECC